MDGKRHSVFVTGGTGYLGGPLITALLERGHTVRALIREESRNKLPPGCLAILGNALDGSSYATQIRPSDTFVQLVGVAHPSPAQAAQFRNVDLVSASAAIRAASAAGIRHFIYLRRTTGADDEGVRRARAECETMIRQSGLNATLLRPWYVLGPGHRWPYALLPMYWLLEQLPRTRDGARRLGLVTRSNK
jgi:uncharacterized protein YbjT (DUF2867 family)